MGRPVYGDQQLRSTFSLLSESTAQYFQRVVVGTLLQTFSFLFDNHKHSDFACGNATL